jgi:hypothetical protein
MHPCNVKNARIAAGESPPDYTVTAILTGRMDTPLPCRAKHPFIFLFCVRTPHMDADIRDRFIARWQKYCPGAELPITFEVSEKCGSSEKTKTTEGWHCVICDLARVRKGKSLVLDQSSVTCSGGRLYMGYDNQRSENFRYFLSTGLPGIVEGERYKSRPEIVDELILKHHFLPPGGRYYLFRRWDMLTEVDDPDVVIFFARPEVLSALFTLANFDQADPNGVICPFGSGCSSIIHYPRLEQQCDHPRAVFGMFDPSARPCVPTDILTIAIPMKKFVEMIGFMDESFLTTKTWDRVKSKIALSSALHSL